MQKLTNQQIKSIKEKIDIYSNKIIILLGITGDKR